MVNPREIDRETLKTKCLIGQGAKTCRYIAIGSYLECLKHTSAKGFLDKRVRQESITARGDNCEGIEEKPE